MKKISILISIIFSSILCYAEDYEYYIVKWSMMKAKDDKITENCNRMAELGWRLIAVNPEQNNVHVLFFERIIQIDNSNPTEEIWKAYNPYKK